MSYNEITSKFRRLGFKQERPVNERTAIEDENICKRTSCPSCGTKGLEYKPFIKLEAYRAVCKCPRCSYAEEF